MKGVVIIQTPTVWFGTFAVNLEVNDDWLHSPFAVPSETFPRPPAHLPHEEFPDTAAHRSRPEKLILAQTKEEQDRKSNKSHRSGRSRKTTVWKGQQKKRNKKQRFCVVLRCVACVCLCTQTFFSHACGPDVDKSSELRTWAPVEPVKKPGTILDWAQASTFQTNTAICFTSESQNAFNITQTCGEMMEVLNAHRSYVAGAWGIISTLSSLWKHHHSFALMKAAVTGHSCPVVTTIVAQKNSKKKCQSISEETFCGFRIKTHTTSLRFGHSFSGKFFWMCSNCWLVAHLKWWG